MALLGITYAEPSVLFIKLKFDDRRLYLTDLLWQKGEERAAGPGAGDEEGRQQGGQEEEKGKQASSTWIQNFFYVPEHSYMYRTLQLADDF